MAETEGKDLTLGDLQWSEGHLGTSRLSGPRVVALFDPRKPTLAGDLIP